jgi:hypothetical protein
MNSFVNYIFPSVTYDYIPRSIKLYRYPAVERDVSCNKRSTISSDGASGTTMVAKCMVCEAKPKAHGKAEPRV